MLCRAGDRVVSRLNFVFTATLFTLNNAKGEKTFLFKYHFVPSRVKTI